MPIFQAQPFGLGSYVRSVRPDGTSLPMNEATPIKYAPTARQYNPRVITDWQSTPLTDVLRGDHVHSTELGITHSIVEKKAGTILQLIGCVVEDKKLAIKQFAKDVESAAASLEVARYSSPKNSGTAVRHALSLVGSDRVHSFVDNEIDFVMLCKRGKEIKWESTYINYLERGDHIKWGFKHRHHGIVQQVNTRRGSVMCFMYTYKGIKCMEIRAECQFKRAIYNSLYDTDTVLKLAESRIGETKYHLADNNDSDFARWCKTGKQKARLATKTSVRSADMLKSGDQVSWTRKLTYDHHALVSKVLGQNKIEVFEFTTRSGSKVGSKTYKKRTILPIFNGNDPVFKITYIPPEDPEKLLEKAAKQEGEIGGYNPFTNNCENYAGNQKSLAIQARAVVRWLWKRPLNALEDIRDLLGNVVVEEVVMSFATTGATFGLEFLTNILEAVMFHIPFAIELMKIGWDINNDWSDHKKTRIIIGLIGTITKTLVMIVLTTLCSFPVSLPVGILVGIIGSLVSNLVMRSIRRISDRNECRDAFRGLLGEHTVTDCMCRGRLAINGAEYVPD